MNSTIIVASIALILCIVISTKYKLPLGVLAMLSAFLVGNICLGLNVNQIVSQWPTGTIYSLIMATTFFGFISSNGTMMIIGKRMVNRIKGNMKVFPLVATLLYAAVSFAVGVQTTYSLGPIFYIVAIAGNLDPAIIALIIAFAGMIGSVNPWTGYGGLIVLGHIASNGYENSLQIATVIYIAFSLVCVAILLLSYFLLKCYKADSAKLFPKEELQMNSEQKKSYRIFTGSLILICVPAILGIVFPGSTFVGKITAIICPQNIFCAGILLCIVLKLGTFRDALKNVPLSVILMTAGMTMLLYVVRIANVTDLLADLATRDVPFWILPALLTVASAVMSFFASSTSVVVPLFFPVAIQIASITGANPVALMACVLCGAMSSACSPLSAGGIAGISVAPPEVQEELSSKMLIFAIILPIFVAICAGLGLLQVVPSLLGGSGIAY